MRSLLYFKILLFAFCIGASFAMLSCSSKNKFDLVIENVTLFDGDKVYAHATIYVQEGKISRIDTVPGKIEGEYHTLLSGNNKTLIPGLINAHTHPQQRKDLHDAAHSGILTVMDLLRIVEDSIPVFKSLGETSEYSHYYTSGIGADMPDAVIKKYIQKPNPWAPLSANEVEDFIAKRVEKKVDFIKIFQDSRLPQKFSDTLFDKIINEVHKNKLLAVVHSETLYDARFEFLHGADIIAHGWIDSVISNEDLMKWKQRSFYVIPTLLVHTSIKKQLNPKSYLLTEEQMIDEMEKLHQAGIPLLAGSDSPAHDLNFTSDFFKELALYEKAGLSPIEVLKTATTNPARAFQLKNKGVIKKGTPADFVLVDGDVANDLSKLKNIVGVWKGGKRIR